MASPVLYVKYINYVQNQDLLVVSQLPTRWSYRQLPLLKHIDLNSIAIANMNLY